MKALVGPLAALLLLAAAAADCAYYVPRLPAQIAAHVNESGQGNAWEDKHEAIAGTARWATVVTLVALALGSLTALGVRFMPYQFVFIRLPTKDYWLATPQRRREAAVQVLALWCPVGVLALPVYLTRDMFVTTLHPEATANFLLAVPVVLGVALLILVRAVLFAYRLSNPNRPDAARKGKRPWRSES